MLERLLSRTSLEILVSAIASRRHQGVSRPAKVVAALMLVGAVALAIAGYFAAKSSDESYCWPLSARLFSRMWLEILASASASRRHHERSFARNALSTP